MRCFVISNVFLVSLTHMPRSVLVHMLCRPILYAAMITYARVLTTVVNVPDDAPASFDLEAEYMNVYVQTAVRALDRAVAVVESTGTVDIVPTSVLVRVDTRDQLSRSELFPMPCALATRRSNGRMVCCVWCVCVSPTHTRVCVQGPERKGSSVGGFINLFTRALARVDGVEVSGGAPVPANVSVLCVDAFACSYRVGSGATSYSVDHLAG